MLIELAGQQVSDHHSPIWLNAVLIDAGDDALKIRNTEIIAFAWRMRCFSPPPKDQVNCGLGDCLVTNMRERRDDCLFLAMTSSLRQRLSTLDP
jgi:hypothetical protein